MKDSLFTAMMAGFAEAAKHRRKQAARVRVSRFSSDVPSLRPKEIRKIRTALGLSQTDFARYLGTSVACVRSWEQGMRRPHSAALRLLAIAKKKPAALLEFVA
jgi:putative transcriptional regulator